MMTRVDDRGELHDLAAGARRGGVGVGVGHGVKVARGRAGETRRSKGKVPKS